MTQNLHVKLQFQNEFRRFVISKNTKFTGLKEQIQSILGVTSDFTIKYLDDENEWISISSDVELETGLLLSEKIFRLTIEIPSPSPQISSDSVTPQIPSSTSQKDGTEIDGDDEDNDDACRGRRKHWKKKNGCKKWKKHGKMGKRGGWNRMHAMEADNSSDEDDTLPVDQIKQLISSLSEELTLLIENKKAMKGDVAAVRTKIREMRSKPDVSKEEILKLRGEAMEKKTKLRTLFFQIRNTRSRISKLREIALTKTTTTTTTQ